MVCLDAAVCVCNSFTRARCSCLCFLESFSHSSRFHDPLDFLLDQWFSTCPASEAEPLTCVCVPAPGIRQLQLMLLKVSLILGVEVHVNVEFIKLVEPPEEQTDVSEYFIRSCEAVSENIDVSRHKYWQTRVGGWGMYVWYLYGKGPWVAVTCWHSPAYLGYIRKVLCTQSENDGGEHW